MPSFPSYYLNNLERKRQRSRELREGLNEGMAGVLGGVDRLAQMQAALEEKGLRAEALKFGRDKDAEALAHGRETEARNQARADARFKWEEEDRARKMAREDAAARGEIADPDREAMMAGFGETLRGEGVEPTTSDILTKFRAAVENPAEATGRYAEEPGEVEPADVEGQTTSPEATDILSRLKASLEPGAEPMAPAPPSVADKQEAARLRKMEADAAIAERKAKGGAPGVTSLKDQTAAERLGKAKADRLLAERKVQEMQRDPALANAPPTVLQFWGNVKGTAEQMRALGKEVTPDDFSLNAKAQSQMPTIVQSDRVRRVTSMIDRIVQRAGVGMEGGKLAEGDIARYRAMLMNAMDSHGGFVAATQEIAGELDKKVADEQAMFRQGSPAASVAPAADPQAAFMQMVLDLRKQLGRKPTKEEIQAAAQAAGVVIE